MTKWDVRGASLETGQEIRETIVAADYQGVQAALKARKIAAESIKPAKPDAKVSPLAPRPIMTAKVVPTQSFIITKAIAVAFIVIGVLACFAGAFEKFRPLDMPGGIDAEDIREAQMIVSSSNAIASSLFGLGGLSIFAGMALLMLRQIAMNTATRRPE